MKEKDEGWRRRVEEKGEGEGRRRRMKGGEGLRVEEMKGGGERMKEKVGGEERRVVEKDEGLLDVLAARKEPYGLSGVVLIDGKPQPKNFKLVSGYVVQDDVVMGTLTVRENLEFSAALRLPKNVSVAERKERVEDVINELGLTHCADTKVGTEFIRGVSGGERKRTNIGMELIIKPTVLFLDEPTTGLDASTANAVMHLLARLSKRGRTIIFSIHQPRFTIYRLFDKLHLLSLGNTVFHGPADKALDHFTSIGYICEPHNNPPDFFLDVINGDSTAVAMNTDLELKKEASRITQDLRAEVGFQQQLISYPSSFLKQLSELAKRAVKNIIRNPFLTVIQTTTIILFSLIVGMIYFQLDQSLEYGIQNRIGAFFFLIMQQVFGNMSAIELFIRERNIFVHESASGFYRVSAYFFSKSICDLLPMRTIPSIFYCTITYWMIGLKADAGAFFIYTLTLLLTTYTATALAFAISSTVSIAGIATLLIAMCYVLMMIFSGLLVNIASLPSWLRWLQYLSIFRYSQNALAINELKGMEFCGKTPLNTTTCTSGTSYLENQGIDYSVWGLWQNEVALFCMTVGLLVIAYIQLRRMPKLK
ncbi:putative ATP-binding cassette sub-family G member 2 isoform X2 [Apostichopus japonicus]|uniref:Putative ATP-binding cassette sub-family G member 2 isoform X2 n=1 Tax=Stichopus japonicus TaxID=307972 RepID=A0A2G8KS23_STIJA|nr:putative ATP-binding cassette sub-family G member 2 isoform X2 [Apostichopus japonicus]